MGKTVAWLLIAACLTAVFVAGAGRHNASNDLACVDIAGHRTHMITVAPGVQLEVLDWGGNGETMVLITGLGDNAHAYDEFAYQFTDRFRVIGITRRGYGRSSQPAHGYDLATRARDDIAVLDKLNIRQAVFVGHSIGGMELSKLAVAYPDRVRKLVYLDGLDLASGGWSKIPQPPGSPEPTAAEMASVRRLAAASAVDDGYRKTYAGICNMTRRDPAGRITGSITAPEINGKMIAGLQPADYQRIQAPALGFFNSITPPYRAPYYWSLDPAQQAEYDRSVAALAKWVEGAIQRFRTEVQGSKVIELKNTNHYVYVVDESLVVREMRKFLADAR